MGSPFTLAASSDARTTAPVTTRPSPPSVSFRLLTRGQRLVRVLPVHSSLIVSTAATLVPSGKNIPYHVAVASRLNPQINAYEPRQSPFWPNTDWTYVFRYQSAFSVLVNSLTPPQGFFSISHWPGGPNSVMT